MSRRHEMLKATTRFGRGPHLVTALALLAGTASLLNPFAASAAAVPANFIATVDQDGVNDIGSTASQDDITQMGRDDTDPAVYKLFWSWDNVTWSGNNTGNACALFDSTGDGKIDNAACGVIEQGPGGTVIESPNSLELFTCNNTKIDRCAGPTPVSTVGVTHGVLGTALPGDLVTATDPFPAGTASPNDSSLEINVPKALLHANAALVNVCSYPSNGNGGNNNPFDCIVTLAGGSVHVTKATTGTAPAGVTYDVDVTCGGVVTTLHMTPGTPQDVTPVPAGTSCSATETAANSHGATSTTYTLDGNAYTAGTSFTIATGSASNIAVTNNFPAATGTVTVSKSTTGPAPAGTTYDVDVTCAGATTTKTLTPGTPQSVTGIAAGSSCSVAETAANSHGAASTTYTLDGNAYTAGTSFTVAGGSTYTVAVTNNFAPVVVPPVLTPTLGVTKSSVPVTGSVVKRGDTIVYTLDYTNTGNGAASAVVLTDVLPADLDYVAGTASAGGTYDTATRTLSWSLGTLAAGASGAVSFTAQVASTATDGEVLHNVGTITAPGISSPSNADDVTVAVPAPTGNLTVAKSVDHNTAGFGDALTYSVLVGATGNKDQTNVVVTDTVPAKTSYVPGSASCDAPCTASESNGVVTWNVGTVAHGTSTTLTFKVTVDTPASAADGSIPAETIHNVAVGGSDSDPSVESNKVSTDITAVLGVSRHRRLPEPKPQHSPLPFTGLPLLQLMAMAGIAIGGGLMLVQAARTRRALPVAELPPTDR